MATKYNTISEEKIAKIVACKTTKVFKAFQTEEFTLEIFVVCVVFGWGQRHNSGILVKSLVSVL